MKFCRFGPRVCFLLLACFFAFSSTAQTRSFFFDIKGPAAKGTVLWEEGNYKEAVPYLEQALSKRGRGKEGLQKKLAFAYVHTGNAQAAATMYANLLTEGAELEEKHQLSFANALMSAGRLEEGREQLIAYLQQAGMEEKAKELRRKWAVAELYRDTIRYQVQSLPFNTAGAEFSPFLAEGGIIFVSDKPRTGLIKHRFTADNSYGTDLFYGKFGQEGQIHSLSRLNRAVNTPFPEGPAVVTQKGKKLVFTRADEGGGMQLFEARSILKPDSWVSVKPLRIPGMRTVGHPAVAEEGRVIYFVSDDPAGYGGTDIYRVVWENKGWSEPQNLGPAVNTAANEMFPTWGADGILRFSSNGHFGLGGLDIYELTFGKDSLVEIRNIGAPINSPADDFGLSLHESGDWGFFSSNRSGGAGEDDIYRLYVNVIKLAGRVYDKTNRKGVEGVSVGLYKEGTLLEEALSSAHGYYSFKVYPGQEYQLTFGAEEFREQEASFSTWHGPRYGTRNVETGLDRKVKMFVLGTIRKSNRDKAAGASLLVIDQQSGRIDTVFAGERGSYELELDVSRSYTFLAECDKEKAVTTFETPEKGKASLSYYEHLHMEPLRAYTIKGKVRAPAGQGGPFVVSVLNHLTLEQEMIVTDEAGSFTMEAHPLADYEFCLLQGETGVGVYLQAGWSKPERSLELVYESL